MRKRYNRPGVLVGGNHASRLRKMTKAYLTPFKDFKPRLSQTTLEKTDHIYQMVCRIILDYQSVTTGLFPRYSQEKNIGYVKDSIYCALVCWSCSLAYKRLDDDKGRETSLRQSAVKTLRGILNCWMNQIDKVNDFKEKNAPEYALHSRFDLHTGEPLQQSFEHLQMDLVALYILAIVEMTTGGVQIIYTNHEVAFVQNLVFYIERSYRTPDYGMWERGNRYNIGATEIHASSLGMVKSALEAINGFNVFGTNGSSSSVIYVDIDGHNRNRTTFETILPRESNSKNTDAALITTVGWPAFATHNPLLFDKTMNKCLKHLEGKFGLKRYLRDGFRTEAEDVTRKFYTDNETSKFDKVECQFPVFLAYLFLTYQLKGDKKMAEKYWDKLDCLLVPGDFREGFMILPECYYLEEDLYNDEKENPGSQDYYPISPIEFGHHLWSNSVYLIAYMIKEKIIHSSDLDPIYRHLPAGQRPTISLRHSAFRGSMDGDPVVQIALISDSTKLQMLLATYGISTQTPHEIEPVQIWPSWRMVEVFNHLGKSKKLNLGGRPSRPFGSLNTCKIFRFFGETILCYPLIFEIKDFYVNCDPTVIINDIKREIDFVAKRWKLTGRPTFCLLLRDENVLGQFFNNMLNLLVCLKNGHMNGVRVRVGRIHQLINTGCLEHIDFVTPENVNFTFDIVREVQVSGSLPKKDSSIPLITDKDVHYVLPSEIESLEFDELVKLALVTDEHSIRTSAFALCILRKRFGEDHYIDGRPIKEHFERIYEKSCLLGDWYIIRIAASALRKTINNLAPGITNILVRGKQVSIGSDHENENIINVPKTPAEIVTTLYDACKNADTALFVFQQELIIACSDLIEQIPSAFIDVLTIRLSWLKEAIKILLNYLQNGHTLEYGDIEAYLTHMNRKLTVYDLPPTIIKEFVHVLMTKKNWRLLPRWERRTLTSSLNMITPKLFDCVWNLLEKCEGGLVIAGQKLPQYPTLKVLTHSELTFAYKIEAILSVIKQPAHRQLLIELLEVLGYLSDHHPEVRISNLLDCDEILHEAYKIFCKDVEISEIPVNLARFYEYENESSDNRCDVYLMKSIMKRLLKPNGFISNHRYSIPEEEKTEVKDKRQHSMCHIS
uniref:Phosphorylase b kinase regulatory subunit n=1 Tax=Parastrongyloides trichosuri TaxID=131310 RepID=A0A0N5A3W4_PARTI